MPSTHLSLHYHIVFGTKNHEPIIQPLWRGKLHAYLGGIIRTANGIAESVGGVSDHVHLLIGLRATHCLADVLRELKSVSSGWVTTRLVSAILRGRKATVASRSAGLSARRFVATLSNRRNTTGFVPFARSTWNCCDFTKSNSMKGISDSLAPLGLDDVFGFRPVARTTG